MLFTHKSAIINVFLIFDHPSSDSIQTLSVMLKSKPLDTETCNMVNKMAQGCGLDLATLYEQNKHNTGFKYVNKMIICILYKIDNNNYLFVSRHCHLREVEICRSVDPDIKKFMPCTYSTLCDPSKVCHRYIFYFIYNM